ncbi:MAG: hypothetical protein AB1571_00265 [Nanoarchaeota archaeon]
MFFITESPKSAYEKMLKLKEKYGRNKIKIEITDIRGRSTEIAEKSLEALAENLSH